MLKEARKAFNENFQQEAHDKLLFEIENEFPGQLDFRVAETPVFLDQGFKTKLLMASNLIIDFIKRPDFKEITEKAVPEAYRFKNEGEHCEFLCVDFAVCESDSGEYEPQLIELQGFPTLFAWQHYLAAKYRKHHKIDKKLSPFFNRINAFNYLEELSKVIKGESSENTILLEVYPEKQRTRIDFELSKAYFGIEVVCLSEIYTRDSNLFYQKGGTEVRIDRIYNRVIFDEVERKYPELKGKITFLKNAEVKWIANPSWFYRISKYCLPYLKGSYLPESYFLSDIKRPDDLKNFVLKPIFSFAGEGVNLNPTTKDLEDISDRENYILQRKVQYSPFIPGTDGEHSKGEIRLIYIWPEGLNRPKLITSLARLSKSNMLNTTSADGAQWTGSSSVFSESH
ncbi:hypothetical protein [Jiulongibacter sediminis]|uniref:hypothetical protein n=1 Tax=Jiulongibacter sediminis TaxID=1605367 RepID=UPI0006DC6B49|nr:hypothetical protein [Jiulongibacter sediminis]